MTGLDGEREPWGWGKGGGGEECNGPGVVQRKDRQKKEFHDQSDYR